MSLRLIIKQVSRPGQDSRLFRAYNPGKTGQPDISLGITASTTGNADHGARRCAVKAFIQTAEPTADQDEIETRIALRQLVPDINIWEATLQPSTAKYTPPPFPIAGAHPKQLTRAEIIEGLRELYSMAVAQQMSKDDTFAGWPDMVRVIDYIEQHGLPPLTGGDNE